jgi:uncharacterized protein YndB with AHSA1/START domain
MTNSVQDPAALETQGSGLQARIRSRAQIRAARRFRVSPGRVFDAWLEPQSAGLWLFATASRPMACVSIDARVGGAFRFAERPNGGGEVASGRYLEINRPWRLVFTLANHGYSRDISHVSVEIVLLKTGCELVLVQDNVARNAAECAEGRWDGMLYGLAAMLKRG